jgi:hypothetical protein
VTSAVRKIIGVSRNSLSASICVANSPPSIFGMKIVGRLISLGGIVFLEYEIRAGSFQKDFYEVRAVRIIIDDQNPSFSCVC